MQYVTFFCICCFVSDMKLVEIDPAIVLPLNPLFSNYFSFDLKWLCLVTQFFQSCSL